MTRLNFLRYIEIAALALAPGDGSAACEVPLSQWQLSHYTSDDGLPLDAMYTTVQDDTGFLWIGTEDGVARFDGRTFERISFSKAINYASEYVESLLLDASTKSGQSLFIGTTAGGIARIRTTPPYQPETVLDGNFRVYDMARVDDHLILAATRGSGVLIVDTTTGEFHEPLTGRAGSTVYSLAPRFAGGWWVGYGGEGVQWFDGQHFHDVPDAEILSGVHVNSLVETNDEILWIGARDGLYRIESGRVDKFDEKSGLPSDLFVRALMIARNGQLWVGLDNGGIARHCDGQFDYLAGTGGLSQSHITHVTEDTEGNVWVSTGSSGLIQMRQGLARPLTVNQGLPDFPILPIVQAQDGAMWFGTFGGGVARSRDGRIETIDTDDGLVSNQVLSLWPDNDRIWVGTRNGLSLIEDGQVARNWTEAEGLPHPTVGSMMKEGNRLWLGTVEALGELTEEGIRHWLPEGGFGGYIVGLLVDGDGTLWIATDGGGVFMRQGEAIVRAPFDKQLPSRTVTSLYESKSGLLWATTARGLLRWDGTEATVIRPQQGLPDSQFFSANEDDLGGFWLSSNRGVFRLPIDRLETIQPGQSLDAEVIQLGRSDGMPRTETNGGFQPAVWRDDRGRLWYPTTSGAVMIDPALVSARQAPPAPAMLRVLSDSTLIDFNSPIDLPPLPDLVEFAFASPTYQRVDQLKYQYRLLNYDDNWLTTRSGSTIYRRLPAGQFRFEVRARRPAGPFSAATGLDFSVARHPLYNPWLWGLGAIILLSGALLILWAIYRRRERRREQVFQAQKMESIGLLAGGLAHDFNNILTAIMQGAEIIAESLPKNSPMLRDTERILDSAERAAGLTRQLLTFARRQPVQPRWINLRSEITSMRDFIDRLLPGRIQVAWELDDCGRCFVDPVQLQQVLINLIVNARDAIADTGTIQIGLTLVDDNRIDPTPPASAVASLSVRDTGRGMHPRLKAKVFEPFFTTRRDHGGSGLGLAVSYSIVHQAGGMIEVDSIEGKGTCFTIWLPVDPGQPGTGNTAAE